MSRKRGQKKRVDMRRNVQSRARNDDWTRRAHAEDESLGDAKTHESVRAKGSLSRKRTVIVGDDDGPVVDQSLWRPGVVVAVHGLVCRVEPDDGGEAWECIVRRVLRSLLISQRTPIAVGDRVWFSDQSAAHDGQPVGLIERVEPRTATLSRRDSRGREHTIVANADQLLIVASVAQPRAKPHLIDRYLIAAGKGDLRPIIVFNKADLLDQVDADADELEQATGDAFASIEELIAEFTTLGYCAFLTSTVTREGIDRLAAELRNRCTVLSGQSGVGKSSLINAIEPGLNLTVGEVSEDTQKGRHTTTLARLLRLSAGGYLVDTPGIRAFDLWDVAPGELEGYFVEFAPLVPQCRFRDCHHVDEDGCAVRAAAESSQISERRYFSYLKMLQESAASRRGG